MAPSQPPTKHVILITGASTGFGAMAARALARAGHVVYAGIFSPNGDVASYEQDAAAFTKTHSCDLRTVTLDVTGDESIRTAVSHILSQDERRLDVLIHNAGHMAYGPAEAFTPEQFHSLYEINVVACQRVNRAVLPHMRRARSGLVIWVSSSSARGPNSPFLAPYFAAKAAMDSLAQTYAGELTKWGVETSIIVPGIFTKGTSHFSSAGKPEDKGVEDEYLGEECLYHGWDEIVMEGSASMAPEDEDPEDVARAIVRVVDSPRGRRPFRVHLEPSDDGSEIVNGVADRVRREFMKKIGCGELRVT